MFEDGKLRVLLISVFAILFCTFNNKNIIAAEPDVNEISQTRPSEVKVAAIQCSSVLGDVKANREKITKLVSEAAKNGAKIIVLPEACITGYLSQDLKTNWHLKDKPIESAFKGKDPAGFAEEVPGPSTNHFCKLAKQLQIYIIVPLVEVPCIT